MQRRGAERVYGSVPPSLITGPSDAPRCSIPGKPGREPRTSVGPSNPGRKGEAPRQRPTPAGRHPGSTPRAPSRLRLRRPRHAAGGSSRPTAATLFAASSLAPFVPSPAMTPQEQDRYSERRIATNRRYFARSDSNQPPGIKACASTGPHRDGARSCWPHPPGPIIPIRTADPPCREGQRTSEKKSGSGARSITARTVPPMKRPSTVSSCWLRWFAGTARMV